MYETLKMQSKRKYKSYSFYNLWYISTRKLNKMFRVNGVQSMSMSHEWVLFSERGTAPGWIHAENVLLTSGCCRHHTMVASDRLTPALTDRLCLGNHGNRVDVYSLSDEDGLRLRRWKRCGSLQGEAQSLYLAGCGTGEVLQPLMNVKRRRCDTIRYAALRSTYHRVGWSGQHCS